MFLLFELLYFILLILLLGLLLCLEMAPYKRKTDRKTVTAEQMQEAQRKIQDGKSKREVARELGLNECTLRKRLKAVSVFLCYCNFKFIFIVTK